MFKIVDIKVEENKVPQCEGVNIGILPAHPARYYVVGGSGSGKTTLILNLLKRFYVNKDGSSYWDKIYIFSATKIDLDPAYKVLNLDPFHFFGVQEDGIEALKLILKIQEDDIKENSLLKSKKCLIILDDFISSNKFVRSLLQPFIASRKFNTSIMALSQAYHSLIKPCRLSVSCLIYFLGSNRELEKITQDYQMPGKSKKEFINLIMYATKEKFSFFFCDINRSIEDGRFRKNLMEKLV